MSVNPIAVYAKQLVEKVLVTFVTNDNFLGGFPWDRLHKGEDGSHTNLVGHEWKDRLLKV